MRKLILFSLLCISAAAQCGPPNYACTTTATSNVNPPTPPFSSRQPTGTVNTSNGALGTCSANCVQKITGDAFQTGWNTGTTGNITINGVDYRVDNWTPTYATLHTAPGTQTGVTYTNYMACIGTGANGSGTGCLNSVGFDTSLNPKGRNPYVRVSDNQSVNGHTVSSTYDGEDSAMIFSCTGFADGGACQAASTYFFELYTQGQPQIEALQFQTINGISVPQVVAPPIPITGASGIFFSFNDPTVGYEVHEVTAGSQVGDPVLVKHTFALSGGSTVTDTSSQVLDFGTACPLPGGIAFNATYNSFVVADHDSNRFAVTLSVIQGIGGGNTGTFTNGSNAFTMVSGAFTPGDYDIGANIQINGSSSPRYFIATLNGSGTAGTLTSNYIDQPGTGTYSVVTPIGQGTAKYVVDVQLSPAACYVLNTWTGNILASGAWSAINNTPISTGCQGDHSHNSAMGADGLYVDYSQAYADVNIPNNVNCYPITFTQVGTNTGVPCSGNSGNLCVGHGAWGYSKRMTESNPDLYIFPPANANTTVSPFGTMPNPVGAGVCENHEGWRNATAAGTEFLLGATAGNIAATSPAPEYNEVWGDDPSTGLVYRFGHNFICGPGAGVGCGSAGSCTSAIFTAQYSIGAPSRDGQMFAFSSDMQAGLGASLDVSTQADTFIIVLDGGAVPVTVGKPRILLH